MSFIFSILVLATVPDSFHVISKYSPETKWSFALNFDL